MGQRPRKHLVGQIRELKEENQALRAALSIMGGKVKQRDDRSIEVSVPLPRGYVIIRRNRLGDE